MDQLWAPWRMELIAQGDMSAGGCIFCELPKQPAGEAADIRDRRNLILGRTSRAFAILNKFPYNNGHLMVVPRRHVGDLLELDEAEHTELAHMLRVAVGIVKKAYAPQGCNVGMNLGRVAGAGIADHCHWHIVPRWNGDTNFMPVLGETKVMIEHLHASWERLRPAFAQDFRYGQGEVQAW